MNLYLHERSGLFIDPANISSWLYGAQRLLSVLHSLLVTHNLFG